MVAQALLDQLVRRDLKEQLVQPAQTAALVLLDLRAQLARPDQLELEYLQQQFPVVD
jgi:hypothetical protein